MISLEVVQAEIITLLKDDIDLGLRVGVEIREEQWQGTQFDYPCIRTSAVSAIPMGEDLCGPNNSRNRFSVLSMAEDASSQNADINMGLAIKALAGRVFTGAATAFTNPFVSGKIRVVAPGQQSALNDPQNLWTARTTFEVNIYEQIP